MPEETNYTLLLGREQVTVAWICGEQLTCFKSVLHQVTKIVCPVSNSPGQNHPEQSAHQCPTNRTQNKDDLKGRDRVLLCYRGLYLTLTRPCKFFSVFLVRVWHETLCGRAEKTNKAPEINTASFYPCSTAWSLKALKRRSLRNFSGRKKGLSFWARLPRLYEKRSVNVELGAVNGPLGGQVKPLYTSFPVFQHGRGLLNETGDRRSVKNACAIWQAHGQFLKQAHKGRVLFDVRHIPRRKALSCTVN